MTNPFSVIAFVAAATGVALLGVIGRRPAAYNYVGRHHTNTVRPQPASKSALADRVQSAGIDQPTEPDYSDEPTVQLKTTPEVIEPVDADVMCDSTHAVEGDPNSYECEQATADHDPEFCSAFGGEITWQREAVLEVAR